MKNMEFLTMMPRFINDTSTIMTDVFRSLAKSYLPWDQGAAFYINTFDEATHHHIHSEESYKEHKQRLDSWIASPNDSLQENETISEVIEILHPRSGHVDLPEAKHWVKMGNTVLLKSHLKWDGGTFGLDTFAVLVSNPGIKESTILRKVYYDEKTIPF